MGESAVKGTRQVRRKRAWTAGKGDVGSGLLCLVGVIVGGLLLGGCGGTQHTATGSIPPPHPDPPRQQPTPTPSSSTIKTASGTVSDDQGNEGRVTIGVGTPEPLSRVTEAGGTACNATISGGGQSVNSAVAIPLHVTSELTSSAQVPMMLNLTNLYTIGPGQEEVQRLSENTSLAVLWSTDYSSGPQCGNGEVLWNAEDIRPHVPNTWDAWLIIVGAISPDDPSGHETTKEILILPEAAIGTEHGNPLSLTGPASVRCAVTVSVVGSSHESFLAIDPAAVKADGCKQ